jgi:hypothetical protein
VCENGTYVHAKDCKSRFCKTKTKDLHQKSEIPARSILLYRHRPFTTHV